MFTTDKPTRQMIKMIKYKNKFNTGCRKMFLYETNYLPCEEKLNTIQVQGKALFILIS